MYYNGQVGYSTTLAGALAQVYGVPPGQAASASPGSGPGSTVLKYLQQAESYYSQAQAAVKNGTFAAYGSDMASMKAALDNATKAAQAPCPRRLLRLRLHHRRYPPRRPARVPAALRQGGHVAAAEGVRSVLTGHPE